MSRNGLFRSPSDDFFFRRLLSPVDAGTDCTAKGSEGDFVTNSGLVSTWFSAPRSLWFSAQFIAWLNRVGGSSTNK